MKRLVAVSLWVTALCLCPSAYSATEADLDSYLSNTDCFKYLEQYNSLLPEIQRTRDTSPVWNSLFTSANQTNLLWYQVCKQDKRIKELEGLLGGQVHGGGR